MNKLLYRIGLSVIAAGVHARGRLRARRRANRRRARGYGSVRQHHRARTNLEERWHLFQLGYGQVVAGLVSGGLQTGTFPTGELYFGTILDLQTILGIPGASFHVTFDERSGFAPNANAGTQGPLNSNSGPTRATRLSELFWEQAFFDDRIDIRVGRTNPTLDFFTSDFACQFVSSILCSHRAVFTSATTALATQPRHGVAS